MASTKLKADGTEEHCPECGQAQPHEVTLDVRRESSKEQNAEFSRQPYRITECLECGTTTKTRLNSA